MGAGRSGNAASVSVTLNSFQGLCFQLRATEINPSEEMPKQVRHDTLAEVKKRIGVKYCGGCNPSYERVEVVQCVQTQLKNRFLFFRHDEPDIEVMVLLSGCHRACAAQDLNRAVPHYSLTGENDVEALLGWLKSLTVKGDF